MARYEDDLQMNVIRWSQQPTVRKKYPALKLMYHVPNERGCSPREGKRFKLLGVKSGVPDLCLPVPKGKYGALYLELKSRNGKVSDNQSWWLTELWKSGNKTAVCRDFNSAVETITNYLDGKDDINAK